MNKIINYEPQIEIILHDDSVYYAPEKNRKEIEKLWAQKMPILLGEATISGFSIKKIEISKINFSLKNISEEKRKSLNQRIKTYIDNTGRYPSETIIFGWVKRIENGENIYK